MGSTSTNVETVLISGGSGFIASHIVKSFLDAGYKVRATVRSDSTKEKVKKIQKNHPNLSYAIVPDGQADGAYDEAVKGVDGVSQHRSFQQLFSLANQAQVIHTASPFVLQVEDNERDLLKPAIQGTVGILKSIKANAPNVKRVVITSSFASILDLDKGARVGYTYTEKDWNPVTREFAQKSTDGSVGYCASKTLAEKAAWSFIETEKPNFDLATICPPMVYGPAVPDSIQSLDLDKLNTSSSDIYRLMNGSSTEVPDTAFFAFVDVRDVAEAHLKAYSVAAAGGQRYFTTGGRLTYQAVCDIIRKEYPQLKEKTPEGKPGYNGPESYAVNGEKLTKELGIDYTPLDKSIKDMVDEFLVIEKRLK